MASQIQRLSGNAYGPITATGQGRIHTGNVINHFTFVLHRERTLEIDLNERMGITASLTGLSGQATVFHSALKAIVYPNIFPPCPATDLFDELERTLTLLAGLQRSMDQLNFAQERAALTHADHLVTSFTSAVILFRDMQKDLHDLVFTDPTISEDDYEAAIKCLPRMVQRLRDQNKTWSMQLEILDTPDTAQARRISQSLDERIRAVLAENAELKSRMDRMEHEIQSRARRSTIVATEVKSQLGERSDERPALEDQARVSWTPREFEKILELSRVYRRNRRGSEIFDFDSSIMRSYSLSDLSLSNISIISVIALPIQVSEVDEDGKWYKQKDLQIIPEHADYDSEDDDATIRARKDTLEDDSLADELDRAFYPADPPVLRDLPSNESPVRPVLLDQGGKALPPPSMDVVIQRMERDFDRGRGKAKSEPVAPRARPDSPFPKSEWDVMTYKSYAQRLFDAESTVHETTAGTSQSSTGPSTRTKQNESTEVLFICASLYAFDLNVSRLEAGYPYLTYAAGDIFDVLARVGELWLARNQEDDSKGELGWVWEKHFVILEADPRFFEDVEGQAFLEKHSTIWTKANAV